MSLRYRLCALGFLTFALAFALHLNAVRAKPQLRTGCSQQCISGWQTCEHNSWVLDGECKAACNGDSACISICTDETDSRQDQCDNTLENCTAGCTP